MINQIRANLLFADPDEARKVFNYLKRALPNTSILSPAQTRQERSIIELIENNHGTHPTTPCVLVEKAQGKENTRSS